MFAETTSSATTGWLPALTAVVGFVTASVLDWLKDVRAHKRERESRDTARRDSLSQRRNDFQRQTLLDLQRSVHKVMRSTAQMHHFDCVSVRSGSEWHKELYPKDMNDEALEARIETTILRVRVLDSKVRELCVQIGQQQSIVGLSKSEAEGDQYMDLASATFQTLNDRIGEVLRSLDNID